MSSRRVPLAASLAWSTATLASSIATGAATNYQLEIHNSSLVGNTNDAVHTTVLGGANMVVIVDPTAATGSGNDGFEFDVNGAACIPGGISQNSEGLTQPCPTRFR